VLVRSAAALRTAAQQGLDGSAGPAAIGAAQQRLQQQQTVFGAALGQPAFRALAAALQQHTARREGWRSGRLQLVHATNERRCGQAPLYGWAAHPSALGRKAPAQPNKPALDTMLLA
jgi:hypothetical protein